MGRRSLFLASTLRLSKFANRIVSKTGHSLACAVADVYRGIQRLHCPGERLRFPGLHSGCVPDALGSISLRAIVFRIFVGRLAWALDLRRSSSRLTTSASSPWRRDW